MPVGDEARALLRSHNFGVLSTHSVDMPGYPFGSVTPYALDRAGEPLVLLSAIAQHTKNIAADARVSLTVLDANAREPQAASRLTVLADVRPVPDSEPAARAVYVSHLPDSAGYVDFHDFALYRLDVRRARFIGGFGKIHWVAADDLRRANPLADSEAGIVEHMNADHGDALTLVLRAIGGIDAETVVMSGIDGEGFDVLADGVHRRLAFDTPIATPEEARAALVALVRRARAA